MILVYASLKATEMHEVDIDTLIDMVRNDPSVSGGIRRLMNSCLARGLRIEEQGNVINANLMDKISAQYMSCLRSAIEMNMVCGFSAFYIRRVAGIPMPFVPELGTYTWSVTTMDKKHASKRRRLDHAHILCYTINMLAGNVKADELFIVNWVHPIRKIRHERVSSPLAHVLKAYEHLQVTMSAKIARDTWNAHKHVVLTEILDLKDPTPSGIQLLDDLRRYQLTGAHKQSSASSRMYTTVDQRPVKITTVVDAKLHWMQRQFDDRGDESVVTHMLPPNMQAMELNALADGETIAEIQEKFNGVVHTFFNGSTPITSGAKYVGAAAQDHVSRSQQVTVMAMCAWLQTFAEHMYCSCFKVDSSTVQCLLPARSRFEISSTDDVKTLVDAQVLTESDRQLIRKLYLGEGSDDPV